MGSLPADLLVHVFYREGDSIVYEEVEIDDVLDAGDILPGFQLALKDIFNPA